MAMMQMQKQKDVSDEKGNDGLNESGSKVKSDLKFDFDDNLLFFATLWILILTLWSCIF